MSGGKSFVSSGLVPFAEDLAVDVVVYPAIPVRIRGQSAAITLLCSCNGRSFRGLSRIKMDRTMSVVIGAFDGRCQGG